MSPPTPARKPLVLPAQLSVRCSAYLAELASADARQIALYLQWTGSGIRTPGSPYFWRHWPREFGPFLTLLLQEIRVAGMAPRGAALTHDRLAFLCRCDPDTIRLFLRWLRGDQERAPFKIPGDPEYVREVVRTYVPQVARDPYFHGSGVAPYRYWPLAAEVIHRDHLEAFSTVEEGAAAGQRYFSFPELWGIGLDGGNELILDESETSGNSEPRHGRGLNPDPRLGSESEPMAGQGVEPPPMSGLNPDPGLGSGTPHTPHACMLLAASEHAATTSTVLVASEAAPAKTGTSPEVAPAKTGTSVVTAPARTGTTWSAAAAALGLRLKDPLELAPDIIAQLDTLPDGRHWRECWQVGVQYAVGINNPTGLLIRAVQRAAAGVAAYQAPPAPLATLLEEADKRQKQRTRTASVVAERPDPFAAQKQAPKPERAAAVQPEAALAWERLIQDPDEMRRAMLSAVTAVLLDGTVLSLQLPTANAEVLRRHRGRLQSLAQEAQPGITELRLVPTKGGR